MAAEVLVVPAVVDLEAVDSTAKAEAEAGVLEEEAAA